LEDILNLSLEVRRLGKVLGKYNPPIRVISPRFRENKTREDEIPKAAIFLELF